MEQMVERAQSSKSAGKFVTWYFYLHVIIFFYLQYYLICYFLSVSKNHVLISIYGTLSFIMGRFLDGQIPEIIFFIIHVSLNIRFFYSSKKLISLNK